MKFGDWQGWRPALARAAGKDVGRTALGATVGMLVSTLLVLGGAHWGLGSWLALFAPLGATAVLVFAAHNSPLAQPWSCVVGNTVSALWALAVVAYLPASWAVVIPLLAVGGAIACMQLARALHPPGGAMALLLTLEAQHGTLHDWTHALVPVGAMTLVLVLVGMLYHRLWGKVYPLQATPAAGAAAVQAGARPVLDLSTDDLQALLTRFDQGYNLTAQELGQLVAAAEEQAIARRFGSVQCGEVMTASLQTCGPQDSIQQLAAQFHQYAIKSLPVVDGQGRLLGVVPRSALFDWLWQQQVETTTRRPWRPWRLWGGSKDKQAAAPTCAADLMEDAPLSVQDSTPVATLLQELAQHTVPFVAVLRHGQLAGLITRTDIMRILLR